MNTVTINRVCIGLAVLLFVGAGVLAWFSPASLVAFGLAILAFSFFI